MAGVVYFVQECPTCGRHLQIRVEYLGRKVVCQHCQGQLTAADPANVLSDCEASASALLRRADELLESVVQRKSRPR